MKIAGVNLKGGKIINLVVDSVPTVPPFDPALAGEFIFSLDDKVLRFNSGENLVPLNTTVSEDPNLIASLNGIVGSSTNWLNSDLSFNPVEFNALPGISGLDSNDNLFAVISQITTLVDNASEITLLDIIIPEGLPNMAVVAQVGGSLIIVEIETVLEGSTISLNFDNLEGFNITDTTEGNIIAFDPSGDLTSRVVYYRYENLTANHSHLVNHNLGEKYCNVFCIDPQTDQMIIPDTITFSTPTQLVIDFATERKLIALVTSMPLPSTA